MYYPAIWLRIANSNLHRLYYTWVISTKTKNSRCDLHVSGLHISLPTSYLLFWPTAFFISAVPVELLAGATFSQLKADSPVSLEYSPGKKCDLMPYVMLMIAGSIFLLHPLRLKPMGWKAGFEGRRDGSRIIRRSLWSLVSCAMILGSRLCIMFVVLKNYCRSY